MHDTVTENTQELHLCVRFLIVNGSPHLQVVLNFQVLHCPPLTFGPAFSGPAFSAPPLTLKVVSESRVT